MYTREDIENILIDRDFITRDEAINIVDECIEELQGAIMRGNYTEAEDIIALYLGLEPDYLEYLLTL